MGKLRISLMPNTALAAALTLGVAFEGSASATVVGFVAAPASNSISWASAVTGQGGTINTAVNFNTMPVGTFTTSNFYTATQGVTISQVGGVTVTTSGIFDGFGNTNTGEGVWTTSGQLRAPSGAFSTVPAESVTFTFNAPILGAGIFLIDYFGATPWTITARNASNTVLGSFSWLTGANENFQQKNGGDHYKYFLGIESTAVDIKSLTISRPGTSFGQGGDNVGLDDLRFATVAARVPEPVSLALLGIGLLGLGVVRRTRF